MISTPRIKASFQGINFRVNPISNYSLGSSNLNRGQSKVVEIISKKLGQLQPSFAESHINEIRKKLREETPKVHTPMLVSIGPYHRGNSNLSAMNVHKLHYLDLLLKRRNENSLERYAIELKTLEENARVCYAKCYAKPIHIESYEFMEMMLLDGCFIIEFLRKGYLKHVHGKHVDDPIFNENGMDYHIRRDMMLLDNQLPHFVLSACYNMTKDPKDEEEDPFMERAMSVFTGMIKKN